jgi:SAM-dependent methyltransferase
MNATTPIATTLPVTPCAACGASDYGYRAVLWPELVQAWGLTPGEEAYINRQQGLHCNACGNNLRMISLAAGLLRALGAEGTLQAYCRAGPAVRVLEINTAGFLTQFLRELPGHRLVEFPAFDMMALDLPDGSFDVVVHSDSLEHVPDPVRGLEECLRVLRPAGQCVFTVPVVVGRLTRSRDGLPPSYHGRADTATQDQLVRTEFGADLWRYVLEAGFESCEIFAFDHPAALVVVARKAGK